jgi:hypothetical protein
MRWLSFYIGDQDAERAEEHRAREAITLVAIRYLASAAKGDAIHQRAVKQLQDAYRHRAEGFEIARKAFPDNPEAQYMTRLISLERESIGIQRTTLIDLRDHDAFSDDVLRRLQVLLDLEESQLEEEGHRWSA